MTNNAYAKNNGDGLLCSILCSCAEPRVAVVPLHFFENIKKIFVRR